MKKICIIGDWENDKEAFDKAEKQLIETERDHHIYGTKDIVNPVKLFKQIPGLDIKQQVDLLLHVLSYCDIAYCLFSWEHNTDFRLLHDYCATNGYKIIYSKKF